MADTTKTEPKAERPAPRVDYSQPGWPERTALMRDVRWYEQFPEQFRPLWPEGGVQTFGVRSIEDAQLQQHVAGGEHDHLVIVNLSHQNTNVDVPCAGGYRNAVLRPFAVISLPAPNAKQRCELFEQNESDYPMFALLAAKGDCRGAHRFQLSISDAFGNPLDKYGKRCDESHLPPAKEDEEIETCEFYGCSHPYHWTKNCPPLSLQQSYHVLRSYVAATPSYVPDFDASSGRILKYTEIDRRVLVGSFASRQVDFARRREAAIRAMESRGQRVAGR